MRIILNHNVNTVGEIGVTVEKKNSANQIWIFEGYAEKIYV